MPNKPTIVKKYANRRLYDTATSTYITLDDIYAMIKEDYAFKVVDAKTGRDITRLVFLQIISDKELGRDHSFSTEFLKDIIALHASGKLSSLPDYMEHALKNYMAIGKSKSA